MDMTIRAMKPDERNYSYTQGEKCAEKYRMHWASAWRYGQKRRGILYKLG